MARRGYDAPRTGEDPKAAGRLANCSIATSSQLRLIVPAARSHRRIHSNRPMLLGTVASSE